MILRLRILTVALALLVCGVDGLVTSRFLGTCLTQDWVKSIETTNHINASARDSLGRLTYHTLHPARTTPVVKLNDFRTASKSAFLPENIPKGGTLYGAGVKVDGKGNVIDPGVVEGSIIVELNEWASHWLASQVYSILASEVVGFPVTQYNAPNARLSAQRMTTVQTGLLTPVHVNLEHWTPGKEDVLRMYSNESFSAGAIGYVGTSGFYTTRDFVKDFMNTTKHANVLHPAYWMSYAFDEDVITAVPQSSLRNNSDHFPPAVTGCADNVMGCLNHCAKTAACTDREAKGKECMVVAMMDAAYSPGYFQAVLANLGVPTYICFLGFGGLEAFVLDMQKKKQPVVFYHYEPDVFHTANAGLFERIFLPRSDPLRAASATGTFGENGYGKTTTNPVDVDFPALRLVKWASGMLQTNKAAAQLTLAFTLEELDMYNLQRMQAEAQKDPKEPDPTFRAACKWVQNNFNIWSSWIDRLPLCTLESHIQYTATGCDDADGGRTLTFAWIVENPTDPKLPYECDGGLSQLPNPIRTSRSCEWISENPSRWRSWISQKPECDASFYKYNVTACDAWAKRTVQHWWLLPDPTDASKSLECQGGVSLPSTVQIDCDFMPTKAGAFAGVAVIAGIMIVLQVAAMMWVFVCREKPIVKRSQYEFLLLMLLGGVLVCLAAILYAGEPSRGLCAGRPFVISIGFTTVFGSLLVKSLRVYRVFMKTALKRVTVTVWMMIKVFSVFFVVDVLILGVWFIADFPEPTVTMKPASGFAGDVDRIQCKSTSFMFTAILIFWKAMLLFMGLYISFLVRNVSADFQESTWIFASSVIVLVCCLFILPLAYMIEMAAAAFYMFLAAALLVSTAVVMSMMLVPKLMRLNEEAKSSAYSASGPSKGAGHHDDRTTSTNHHHDSGQTRMGAASTTNGGSRVGPSPAEDGE